MKYQEIITEIDKKNLHPIYFLTGEENYYIDKVTEHISENILTGEEKEFNQSILYGKETDVATIISEAKQFPFGSNHRVVIVKEAQQIRSIDKLETYVKNPLKSTILVICYKYKKIDKRKRFWKELGKNVVLFESKRLYDNQIPEWIKKHLKSLEFDIDNTSCNLLSEYLGNDLSRISNELSKLTINLNKGDIINSKIIEENIGISKDFNVYELQNALGDKDVIKVNKIIEHFANNPKSHPLTLTITSLFTFFQKIMTYHYLENKERNNVATELGIHPFFVSSYVSSSRNYSQNKLLQIFQYLKECDMKSKGIHNPSTSHTSLLKELTFKILN